jgi:hypothetical protein
VEQEVRSVSFNLYAAYRVTIGLPVIRPLLHLEISCLLKMAAFQELYHDFPQLPHEAQLKYFHQIATDSLFAILLNSETRSSWKNISRLGLLKYFSLFTEVIRNE